MTEALKVHLPCSADAARKLARSGASPRGVDLYLQPGFPKTAIELDRTGTLMALFDVAERGLCKGNDRSPLEAPPERHMVLVPWHQAQAVIAHVDS